MGYIDTCPHCGTNLIGDEIPANRREHFGDSTRWTRLIHHGTSDGTVDVEWFECPDCHTRIAPDVIRTEEGQHDQTEAQRRHGEPNTGSGGHAA